MGAGGLAIGKYHLYFVLKVQYYLMNTNFLEN